MLRYVGSYETKPSLGVEFVGDVEPLKVVLDSVSF